MPTTTTLHIRLIGSSPLLSNYPSCVVVNPHESLLSLFFKDGRQDYQLRISHTPSDEWLFEIIALDENSNQIEMDSGMEQFVFGLISNNSLSFTKKSMDDAVKCAEAMQNNIESNGYLCK